MIDLRVLLLFFLMNNEKIDFVYFKSDHSCSAELDPVLSSLGHRSHALEVDSNGSFDLARVINQIKDLKGPAILNFTYVNNETGIVWDLDIAEKIVPIIREKISPAKYDLEIHIDVGALGPTRSMIKEVVGMVNGNGFVAKTKPESWAASSVADKHA